MTNRLYTELAWLPAPPSDFAEQCRQLRTDAENFGKRARRLANHRLNETELNRLANAMRRAREAGHSLEPLTPFRLGILSNATSHFLVPALVASALRYGISLECVEADYGQTIQAALSPTSPIHLSPCDAVLVAIDHHGLPLRGAPGDTELAKQAVTDSLGQLDTIRKAVHELSGAVCILQTLPHPVESSFGSLDLVLAGTPRSLIDELNRNLARSVLGTEDLLLDVAHIAETVGLADWHDATQWNMAKMPFAFGCLPLYAEHVCRLVAALRGKSRKCLVLDLDNTLWGGIIGDDGLDGIILGQGDATGEAHLDVQRTALALRARGVVLAVSSKNSDDVAREPFRKHPEMLLREEHIAVFQANWQDKATNLVAIADALSLGLDALVFLDDNPVERDLVRRTLPEVAVPELPSDPALYARTLLAGGYFEATTFSSEDRKRAEFYQDNARRLELQKQAGNVDAYLESLAMRLTVQPFDDVGRARITQLINKSNQFNLTTKRYTEAEVRSAQYDANALTLQLRLCDSFGDNGIISVLICRREESDFTIDTWLMSCRVLGRKVEVAALQELILEGQARGVRRLIGHYRPTEKNKLVKDHYENLGFTLLSRQEDGGSVWQLDVTSAPLLALPMVIERPALEPQVRPAAEPSRSHVRPVFLPTATDI